MNITSSNQSAAEIKTPVTKGGARAGSGRKPKNGVRTSIYPSVEVDTLWKALAIETGSSQIVILEEAIRRTAREHGLTAERALAVIEEKKARERSG